MEVNYGESSSFIDQRSWQEKAACYREFVNRFRGKRLVALEFGVGRRNQMKPFEQRISVNFPSISKTRSERKPAGIK